MLWVGGKVIIGFSSGKPEARDTADLAMNGDNKGEENFL